MSQRLGKEREQEAEETRQGRIKDVILEREYYLLH
jgi:hypothetical protein